MFWCPDKGCMPPRVSGHRPARKISFQYACAGGPLQVWNPCSRNVSQGSGGSTPSSGNNHRAAAVLKTSTTRCGTGVRSLLQGGGYTPSRGLQGLQDGVFMQARRYILFLFNHILSSHENSAGLAVSKELSPLAHTMRWVKLWRIKLQNMQR